MGQENMERAAGGPGRVSGHLTPVLVGSVTTMLLVAIVTGIPGSPLTPVLPPGGGPLALFRVPAKALGLTSLSPSARVVVAGVVMALASAGFLLGIREAWRGSIPLWLVLAVGIGFHALAVAVPLFNTRDVFQYAMHGRIAAVHGANPFAATPSDFRSDPLFRYIGPEWRNTPAFYGPASIELSERVVRSVHSLPDIVLAFKAMAAVASLATVGLVALLARRLAPARASFATALFAWNPVVIYSGVAGGHNDLFVALAVALALWLAVLAGERAGGARLGMELLGTAVLTVGTLVKAPAALPLVLFVAVSVARTPRGRRLPSLLGHLTVAGALVFAFVRPFMQTHDPTLGMRRLATFSSYLAPVNFFRVLLARLLAGSEATGWAGVVTKLVRLAFPFGFAVAFFFVIRALMQKRDGGGAVSQGAGWGTVLLVFTLAAPMLFPWYLVWMLPLAWLLPRAQRWTVVVLSLALPLFSIATDPGPAPHAYDLVLALGTSVAAPAFFVLLLFVLRTLRDRLRAGLPLEDEALSAQGGVWDPRSQRDELAGTKISRSPSS